MSSLTIENLGSDRSVLEEVLDVYEYEEEDSVPPEFQVADRHFKKYCSCKDGVPCNFCRWFFAVKNCPAHGSATKRTLKPCLCQNEEGINENEKGLEGLDDKANEANSQPTLDSSCLKLESQASPCQCFRKKTKSHGREGEPMVDYVKQDELVDLNEGEDRVSDVSCRCSDDSDSDGNSSTEVDTNSSIGSWNLSSDSCEEVNIGEGLDGIGSSSGHNSSEDSSIEGRVLDANRVKWNATSELHKEVSVEPKEVDLLAAQWGIKNIYGKKSLETQMRPEQPIRDEYCYYKYRLVQKCSRKDYFLKTCKKAINKT